MDKPDLDALEAKRRAGTQGKWWQTTYDDLTNKEIWAGPESNPTLCVCECAGESDDGDLDDFIRIQEADAALIAAAVNALQPLIDWVRELGGALDGDELLMQLLKERAEYVAAVQERDQLKRKLSGECETCNGGGGMVIEDLDGDGTPVAETVETCTECSGSGQGWVSDIVKERNQLQAENERLEQGMEAFETGTWSEFAAEYARLLEALGESLPKHTKMTIDGIVGAVSHFCAENERLVSRVAELETDRSFSESVTALGEVNKRAEATNERIRIENEQFDNDLDKSLKENERLTARVDELEKQVDGWAQDAENRKWFPHD